MACFVGMLVVIVIAGTVILTQLALFPQSGIDFKRYRRIQRFFHHHRLDYNEVRRFYHEVVWLHGHRLLSFAGSNQLEMGLIP